MQYTIYKYRFNLLLIFILGTFSPLTAQVNIQLIQHDHNLEILLIPETNFQGVISNVQFSLRWENENVQLGSIQQASEENAYIPMKFEGNNIHHEGYIYQKIAGFGLEQMSEEWQAMDEMVLMSIPIIEGNAVFEIVNLEQEIDANGKFYVELNGEDTSGDILEGLIIDHIEGLNHQLFSIYPNPFSEKLIIQPNEATQDFQLSLQNTLGEIVWESQHTSNLETAISTTHLSSGIYILKIQTQDGFLSRKVLKGN